MSTIINVSFDDLEMAVLRSLGAQWKTTLTGALRKACGQYCAQRMPHRTRPIYEVPPERRWATSDRKSRGFNMRDVYPMIKRFADKERCSMVVVAEKAIWDQYKVIFGNKPEQGLATEVRAEPDAPKEKLVSDWLRPGRPPRKQTRKIMSVSMDDLEKAVVRSLAQRWRIKPAAAIRKACQLYCVAQMRHGDKPEYEVVLKRRFSHDGRRVPVSFEIRDIYDLIKRFADKERCSMSVIVERALWSQYGVVFRKKPEDLFKRPGGG